MTFSTAAACLAAAAMLSAAPSDRPTLSLADLEGQTRNIAGHEHGEEPGQDEVPGEDASTVPS